MEFLRSAGQIINYKTLIVTVLAIFATWYCLTYNIYAEFPLTLVGIAVVFPVVFSINSAYTRRERALRSLAECKGFMVGFYRTAMDHLDKSKENPSLNLEFRNKILEVFRVFKSFFESDQKNAKKYEAEIYTAIHDLSKMTNSLREFGLGGRFVSRLSQYLTRFTVGFENMKVIFYYRTPKGIRAYSKIFIYAFPVLYAPYFAWLSQKYAPELPSVLFYLMPTIYSFILVSLANIQDQLENPYDQIGEDDITIDLEEVDNMLI